MDDPATPIAAEDILAELECAIADHLEWLKAWHRGLVCDDPPFADDLAFDPHHLCRFGSWYVRNQHRGLVDQPAVHALARLHKEMHDAAQILTAAARAGRRLQRQTYDVFMDAAAGFIAQARRLEKAFARASSQIDPLTGLHNRQAMAAEVEREWQRNTRTGRPCCLAVADIDHFKKVNDGFGHAAGDQVLKTAADCFLAHVRPYDSVYRFGGEEFLICLPEADPATAREVMERLRDELERLPVVLADGQRLNITASFGIAAMDGEADTEEIKERADRALYAAKQAGRNRVMVWPVPN
jgi:diguanylate cyclase (GGDEF)-like protein